MANKNELQSERDYDTRYSSNHTITYIKVQCIMEGEGGGVKVYTVQNRSMCRRDKHHVLYWNIVRLIVLFNLYHC